MGDDKKPVRLGTSYHRAIETSPEQARVEQAMDKSLISNDVELMASRDIIQREMPGVQFGFSDDYHVERGTNNQGAFADFMSGLYNAGVSTVEGVTALPGAIGLIGGAGEGSWADQWVNNVNNWADNTMAGYSDAGELGIFHGGGIAGLWAGLGNGLGTVLTMMGGSGIAGRASRGITGLSKMSSTVSNLDKINKAVQYSNWSSRAGGFMTSMAQMYPSYYKEARQAGLDPQTAMNFAMGLSGVVSLSESWALDKVGKTFSRPMTNKVGRESARETLGALKGKVITAESFKDAVPLTMKSFAQKAKAYGAKMFEGAAVEGGQEFVQSYIEDFSKYLYDQTLGTEDAKFGVDPFSKDSFLKAVEGGFIGGLIGGGMGSGVGSRMPFTKNVARGIQGESAWSVIKADVKKGRKNNIAALNGYILEDVAAGKYSQEEGKVISANIDEMYKFAKSIEPLNLKSDVAAYQLYQMNQVSDIVNKTNQSNSMNLMVDNPVIQKAYKQRENLSNAITEQINEEMAYLIDKDAKVKGSRESFENKMDKYVRLFKDINSGKKKMTSEKLAEELDKLSIIPKAERKNASTNNNQNQQAGKPEEGMVNVGGKKVSKKLLSERENVMEERESILDEPKEKRDQWKKRMEEKYQMSYDDINDVIDNPEKYTEAKTETKSEPKKLTEGVAPITEFNPTEDLTTKNPDVVNSIVDSINKGEDIEPVEVVEGKDGKMDIIDGHHRYLAHEKTGKDLSFKPATEESIKKWKAKNEYSKLVDNAVTEKELDAIIDQSDNENLTTPDLLNKVSKQRELIQKQNEERKNMSESDKKKSDIERRRKKSLSDIRVPNGSRNENNENYSADYIDISRGLDIAQKLNATSEEELINKINEKYNSELNELESKEPSSVEVATESPKENPIHEANEAIEEDEFTDVSDIEAFPDKDKVLNFIRKNTVIKPKEQRTIYTPSQVDSKIKNNPELYSKIASHYKKLFPGVSVEYLNDALRMGGPNVMARIINGIIQINPDVARQSSIIHEYAHIFVELLGDEHPWIKAGLKTVEGTEYYNWSKQEYSDKLKNEQLKEALIQAIAEKSLETLNKKFNNGLVSNFMDWMKRFWNKVKSRFTKSHSIDMVRLLSDEMTFASKPFTVPRNMMYGVKMEQRLSSPESVIMDHAVNSMILKRIEIFLNPQLSVELNARDPHVYYYNALNEIMESYLELLKTDPIQTIKQFGGFQFIPKNEFDKADMFNDFFFEYQRYFGNKGGLDESIRRAAQSIANTNTEISQDDNEDAVKKDRSVNRIKGDKQVNDTITSIINSLVDDQGFPIGKDNIQQYLTSINKGITPLVEKVRQDALDGKSIEAVRLNDLFDALSSNETVLNSFKTQLSSLGSNKFVSFDISERTKTISRKATDEEIESGEYSENDTVNEEISVPFVRFRTVNQNKTIESTQKEIGNYISSLKTEAPYVYSDFKDAISPMFWVDENNKFNFKIPSEERQGSYPNIWKVMKNEASDEDVDFIYNLMESRFPFFVDNLNDVLSEFNVQISDDFINKLIYKKVDNSLNKTSSLYQSQVVSGQIGFITNMIRFMNGQPDNFGKPITINNYLSFIVSDQKNISNLSASFIGVEGTTKQSVSLSHYVNEIMKQITEDTELSKKMSENPLYKDNPIFNDIKNGLAEINKLDGIENILSKKVKEYELLSGTDILLYNILQFSNGSYDRYNQNPMINADRDMTFTVTAKRYNTDTELKQQLNKLKDRFQKELQSKEGEDLKRFVKNLENTTSFVVNNGFVLHPLDSDYTKKSELNKQVSHIKKLIEDNRLEDSIRSIISQNKNSIYRDAPIEGIIRNYILNDTINRIYATDIFIGPMTNLKNTFDVIKRANGATSNGFLVKFPRPVHVIAVNTNGISDSFSVNGSHFSEHIKEQMGSLDEVGLNMKDMLYQVEPDGKMTFLKMSSVNTFRNADRTSLDELSHLNSSGIDYSKIGKMIVSLEDKMEAKLGYKPLIKIVDKDSLKGTNKPKEINLNDLYSNVENGNIDSIIEAASEVEFNNYRIPFNMTHDTSEKRTFEQKSRLSTQLLKIVTNYSTPEELNAFEQSLVDINRSQMGLSEGQDISESKTFKDLDSTYKFIDSLLEGSEERKSTPITILLREIASYNSNIQKNVNELTAQRNSVEKNSKEWYELDNRINKQKEKIASSMDHPMMKRIMEQTIASKMHKDGVRLEVPGQYLHNIPDYGENLKWYRLNSDGTVNSFPEVALPWSMFGETKEEAEKNLSSNPDLADVVLVRVPASGPMSAFRGKVKYLIDGKSNTSILPKEFMKHAGADNDGDKTFVYRRDHVNGQIMEDTSSSKMIQYMLDQMGKPEYVHQGLFELENNDFKDWLIKNNLYSEDDFTISTPQDFSTTASKMNFGMAGIGVVAVGMKMMNMMHQSKAKLKQPIEFNYVFGDGVRQFRTDKYLENFTNDKWEDMAIVVQAVVDMIKDPYVLGMGVDGNTINIASLLIQLGVDKKSVTGFLTDPSIVEYKKALEENDNIFGNKFSGSDEKILEKLLSKSSPRDISNMNNITNLFTEGLMNPVRTYIRPGRYTYQGNVYDVIEKSPKMFMAVPVNSSESLNTEVIKTYIKLKEVANDVFNLGSIMQLDGDLPNGSFETKNMIDRIDSIKSGQSTIDPGNFFERPLIKHYENILNAQWKLMQNRFFTNASQIDSMQKSLSNNFRLSGKKFKTMSDKVIVDIMLDKYMNSEFNRVSEQYGVSVRPIGDVRKFINRMGITVSMAKKMAKGLDYVVLGTNGMPLSKESFPDEYGLVNNALAENGYNTDKLKQRLSELEKLGEKDEIYKSAARVLNANIVFIDNSGIGNISESINELGNNLFIQSLEAYTEDENGNTINLVRPKGDYYNQVEGYKDRVRQSFLELPIDMQIDFLRYQMLRSGVSDARGTLFQMMPYRDIEGKKGVGFDLSKFMRYLTDKHNKIKTDNTYGKDFLNKNLSLMHNNIIMSMQDKLHTIPVSLKKLGADSSGKVRMKSLLTSDELSLFTKENRNEWDNNIMKIAKQVIEGNKLMRKYVAASSPDYFNIKDMSSEGKEKILYFLDLNAMRSDIESKISESGTLKESFPIVISPLNQTGFEKTNYYTKYNMPVSDTKKSVPYIAYWEQHKVKLTEAGLNENEFIKQSKEEQERLLNCMNLM